jgi:hypothetical protein
VRGEPKQRPSLDVCHASDMTSRLPPLRRLFCRGLAGVLGVAFVVVGAGAGCGADNPSPPAEDSLAAKLADAFRIDVSDIDVTYDFWPKASRVEGSATLHFQMRPGQTRALFDFNPLRQSNESERSMLVSLALDGEELDAYDNADLRRIRPSRGAEPAYEIRRRVSSGDEHTLHVTWSMPKPVPPRADDWFYANFDDTEGPKDETETMWPTISSPEDLIHHTIHLRVHSKNPYTVIGSGLVRRQHEDAGVQAWDVDTERPVSSSTVFFAAVPSDQFRTDRFMASGVDVKIVSNGSLTTINRAQSIVRRTIARLIRDFGPFPMPRVQILLTHWGQRHGVLRRRANGHWIAGARARPYVLRRHRREPHLARYLVRRIGCRLVAGSRQSSSCGAWVPVRDRRRPPRVSTRRPMALEPGFSRRSRGHSVVTAR